MFFFISKLLGFLLNPFFWMMVFLLWALATKNLKRRKKLILGTLGILWLFGNGFLINEVLILQEKQYYKSLAKSQTQTAVLLGGFSAMDDNTGKAKLTDAGDRFFQAFKLYQSGAIKQLVVSGGSGSIKKPEIKEASLIRNYFVESKMDTSRVLFESESRNTHENAAFTKALLKDQTKEIGIITSAFHMRRATACFQKVGFTVTPFPSHFLSDQTRPYSIDSFILPSATSFQKWELLFKEWIGYMVYKIKGYA